MIFLLFIRIFMITIPIFMLYFFKLLLLLLNTFHNYIVCIYFMHGPVLSLASIILFCFISSQFWTNEFMFIYKAINNNLIKKTNIHTITRIIIIIFFSFATGKLNRVEFFMFFFDY